MKISDDMMVKVLVVIVALVFSTYGCVSTDLHIHPSMYKRDDIAYMPSNDCKSLERRYAVALAWEKKERTEIEETKKMRFLSVMFMSPLEALMLESIGDTEPETQNESFLMITKQMFIEQNCKPVGYVAYSHKPSKKGQELRGVHSCIQDEETGFYVCLKEKK